MNPEKEAEDSTDNEYNKLGKKRRSASFDDDSELETDRHERLNRERLKNSATIEVALATYKSLYSTITIPPEFIVPVDDKAWPENTWGLPLGSVYDEILITQHREQIQELRRNAGSMMDAKRQKVARVAPETIEAALEMYRSIYSNKVDQNTGVVSVPLKFVVPIGDVQWPEDTWGVKLGVLINDIKTRGHYADHHEIFREMGVDFSDQRDLSGARVEAALVTYRRLYPEKIDATGILSIPCKFVVPINDPEWPEETWGMRLGNSVNYVRNRGRHAHYHERYRELGLDMNRQKAARIPAGKIESALETYRIVYADKVEAAGGTVSVPNSFVVPIGDNAWPEDIWGLRLGNAIRDIRNRGHHARFRDRFIALGLDLETKKNRSSPEFIEVALITYKKLFPVKPTSRNSKTGGEALFIVPPKFVVPTDDANWPAETWGMKLGVIVQNLRTNSYYPDYHERFRKIGLDVKSVTSTDMVDLALQTFKTIHPELTSSVGAISIKTSFVIPSGDEAKTAGWPEELWGLKLGGIVFSIRYRGAYADCKERFRFLDLDYCSQEHSEKVLNALQLYKTLYGVVSIPTKYKVITGDPDWPQEFWGMELGKDVRDILKHGHHAIYHDKMRELGLDISEFDETALIAKAKLKATSRRLRASVLGAAEEEDMNECTDRNIKISSSSSNNKNSGTDDSKDTDMSMKVVAAGGLYLTVNNNNNNYGEDNDDDDVESEYDT